MLEGRVAPALHRTELTAPLRAPARALILDCCSDVTARCVMSGVGGWFVGDGVCADDACAGDVGADDVGADEVGADEVGADDVGADDVGADDVGDGDVGDGDVGGGDVCARADATEYRAVAIASVIERPTIYRLLLQSDDMVASTYLKVNSRLT